MTITPGSFTEPKPHRVGNPPRPCTGTDCYHDTVTTCPNCGRAHCRQCELDALKAGERQPYLCEACR